MTRPAAATLAGLVWASTLAFPAPGHASTGPCDDDSGITVVVDPGPLGGPVRVGCAPSDAGAVAADAVDAAGFEITYADGQPFLCRLDGRPGAQEESCARTPPGDAYWGLFWSDGDTPEWSYSTLGVAALEVPAGGSVGLRFQDGGRRNDPSLPPGGTTDGGGPERPTVDAGAGAAPPAAEAGADDGQTLTWTAGVAVVALTAGTLALASRRRRG